MSGDNESEMRDCAMRKWKTLFDFLDLDRDGFLSLEEYMEFPTQLIKAGKVELGSHLAKFFKSLFEKIGQAVNLSREQKKIGRDLWVEGFHAVSKSEWFRNEFVPTLSNAFFDSMDTNGDDLISLEEWRNYYELKGARDEEFINHSFTKMDENGDGEISREEFNYAFRCFNNYLCHSSDKDFSFLYRRFK